MRTQLLISVAILIVGYLVWVHEKELMTKKKKVGILMVNRTDIKSVCAIADSFSHVYRVVVVEDNDEIDIDTCIQSAASRLTDCDVIMIVDSETQVERSFELMRDQKDPGNLLNTKILRPTLRENLDWRTLNRLGQVHDVVQWVTCL